MEKIIFLTLTISILCFLSFVGVSAISKGLKAKRENNLDESKKEDKNGIDFNLEEKKLSDELSKLNELFKSGVLNQEEFEKAKKKLIED